jgi:hypothetical protein
VRNDDESLNIFSPAARTHTEQSDACMWNLITDSRVKEFLSLYTGALELEMSVGRYFALDHHKMIILSSPPLAVRAAAECKMYIWSRKLFLSLSRQLMMTRAQRAACAFPAFPMRFFLSRICIT